MTVPDLPSRTPLLTRVDAFKRRRPDIPVSPWYANPSGKWEVTEPGRDAPVAYPTGMQMMNDLEARYPPPPPGG